MPKLVSKSRKHLGQMQIVTDKSSTQSSLDVGHDVSPHACAVFVNVISFDIHCILAREFHVLFDVFIIIITVLLHHQLKSECTIDLVDKVQVSKRFIINTELLCLRAPFT